MPNVDLLSNQFHEFMKYWRYFIHFSFPL